MRVLGDIPRLGAKRHPDKTALIMDQRTLTFAQLNTLANRLAWGLKSSGLRPGDRVAVMAQNCLEYPIVVYAAAKCGAVLVPINFRYNKAEVAYVVNNAEPQIIFCGPECAALVAEARAKFDSPVRAVVISGPEVEKGLSFSGLMDGQSAAEPGVAVDPAAAAMIMYTSGTTGFPKGVLYSHAAYLAGYAAMALEGDLRRDDVTMVPLPLFHNGGLNALLQPTLMLGGTALIMPKGFDPDMILAAVGRHRVTLTMWVPTMLAMLVNHPQARGFDLASLDKIWYGSSPISPAVLAAAQELFEARFYQWYGQTESGMNSVLRPEDHARRAHCTGREMFHCEMRIVDPEGGDVAPGEVGEIITAQWPVGMIGYHKMAEATRKTIREGWIHTEDLARVEGGGYFTVVDRMRDMIISGAENIYPKEIEDVLFAHPHIREAAVIGVPDEIYGEAVCAVVVVRPGQVLDEAEVVEFCAGRLAGYKKPRRVVFVDELPKNAAGKVTKSVLRKPFWAAKDGAV